MLFFFLFVGKGENFLVSEIFKTLGMLQYAVKSQDTQV